MRQMDGFAIKELGIPGVVLMENAGKGTFLVIESEFECEGGETVYLFCGKGNNGGDGYVIGRYLWNAGMQVKFFVAGEEDDLKGDALTNYDIVRKLGLPVEFISDKKDLQKIDRNVPDLVVDALLGTGITGAVYGFMKDVIAYINGLDCPVISVDVPSGLNADSPVVEGEAVLADMTVTMALPKVCHAFYPAKNYVGELYIVDIGIPQTHLNDPEVKIQVVESGDIELPERPPDAHKYMCGKLSILAGSAGFTGAAALSSQAALHTGAGMVILGIPASLNPIMETKLTEVITRPYGREILDSAEDEDVKYLLDWCDVLAIGPGLGRAEKTQKTILKILENWDRPAVIDADALYALAENPSIILKKPHPEWILTPHHGEFYRFFGDMEKEKFKSEFISLAREFAQKHQLVLLLKGAPSLVATPQGDIFVNPTGNEGLASGGTGDVLTGIIAGLRAQELSSVDAAVTGQFLHGQCADVVVEKNALYSLSASQLIDEIGKVMKVLGEGRE